MKKSFKEFIGLGKSVTRNINPTHIFIILVLLRFLDLATAYTHFVVNPQGFELRETNPAMVAASKGDWSPLALQETRLLTFFAIFWGVFVLARKGLKIKFEAGKKIPMNMVTKLKLSALISTLIASPLILVVALFLAYSSSWGISTNVMALSSLAGIHFLITCYILALVMALGITHILLRRASLLPTRLLGLVLFLLTLAVLMITWGRPYLLWRGFLICTSCASGVLIWLSYLRER